MIDAQALKRSFAGLAHALGATVDAAGAARARACLGEAELGRQLHAVAPALECLADFKLRITIDIGGIQERHAQVERTMDE